jgi:hypothetical protein
MLTQHVPDLHWPRTAVLTVVFIALTGPNAWYVRQLHAEEADNQKITAESKLTADQAKQALMALTRQLDTAERDVQKMRDKLGATSPTVIQAEQELTTNREALVVYRELLPLLVGERDGEKTAKIGALSEKLATTFAQRERKLKEARQRMEQASESQPNVELMQLQRKLEAMGQALQAREQALVEAKMQLAKFERDRLPQIESGDLKVYTLQALPAQDAALSIESLFGAKSIRVAVDNRTNSLIVYGDREALPTIDALLQRLDQQESAEKRSELAATASQPLVLRVFWLADGMGHDEAIEVLPENVVKAAMKLGIGTPMLVTQSMTTLNVGEKDGVEFATSVPAVLFERHLDLAVGGKLTLVEPDRAAVAMHANVYSKGINSELRGSIAMPLGHYMILGTSNTVIPQVSERDGRGQEDGAAGAGMGESGETTFHSTRFAFVVQVIPAESFAPGE